MPREASGKYPACAREGCTRTTAPGYGGYCPPHAYATGIVNRLVPASDLRALLQNEVDQGVSGYQLAKRSGVNQETVRRILAGKCKRVRKSTATRLMTAVGNTDRRPTWPIQRRLCALRKIGWTVPALAEELGLNKSTILDICQGAVGNVRASTYNAVVDFYDKHSGDLARPEDPRIRLRKWPKPLEWDNIDDPEECPKILRIRPGGSRRFARSEI